MAGKLPSFVNGSAVLIKIGDVYVAYCQDLRFSRNMANVPVRGIGSYSVHTLEPVDYSASGSMSIMRYTTKIIEGTTDQSSPSRKVTGQTLLPANLQSVTLDKNSTTGIGRDGNSLLVPYAFDPRRMLLSATFDIEVYERTPDATGQLIGAISAGAGAKLYTFENCRLTGYSFSFAPGQILSENVSFLAQRIIDNGI